MSESPSDEIELIWGAAEIARFIKRTNRQTYHMLNSGQLPAKKVGEHWVAEAGNLRRHFIELSN